MIDASGALYAQRPVAVAGNGSNTICIAGSWSLEPEQALRPLMDRPDCNSRIRTRCRPNGNLFGTKYSGRSDIANCWND